MNRKTPEEIKALSKKTPEEIKVLSEIAFQDELIKSKQNVNWIGYGKGIDGVSKEKWIELWIKGYTKSQEDNVTEIERLNAIIDDSDHQALILELYSDLDKRKVILNGLNKDIEMLKAENERIIKLSSDNLLMFYLRDKGWFNAEYDNIDLKGFYIKYLGDEEYHLKNTKEYKQQHCEHEFTPYVTIPNRQYCNKCRLSTDVLKK